MKKNLLILIFVTVYFGCKIDPVIPVQPDCNCNFTDSCINEPEPEGLFVNPPIDYYDTAYIDWADFNPNNSDELIYYTPYSPTGPKTIKFNMLTHQKQTLYKGELIRAPKWGRKGWILLNIPDAKICKIKETGDSLTLLPLSDYNYYPEWNYEGDKFIVEHRVITFYTDYYSTLIYDINGNPVDTLGDFIFSGGCWQNENELLLGRNTNNGKVCIVNMKSKNILSTLSQEFLGLWYPDGINIICIKYSCGISVFNYLTLKTKCLIKKCPNDSRGAVSVSFISNKVLCIKSHQKYLGRQGRSPVYFNSNKLVMMNLDGSDEEEIRIN